MSKGNVLSGIGAFLQGISAGMLKKHLEEQELDKEITQGIKKFEKIQKLVETDTRFQDPEKKKMLFQLLGVKEKEENPVVEALRLLQVDRAKVGLEADKQRVSGTRPEDIRANKSLELQQQAKARAAQMDGLKVQLGDVDKQLGYLQAEIKQWQDISNIVARNALKKKYGNPEAFFAQKVPMLQQQRQQISEQLSAAAKQVPSVPSAADAQIPEAQGDDDVFLEAESLLRGGQ